MVIVLALYIGCQGLNPTRVVTFGSVSLNHSLTVPRCKNDTGECGEDRNQRLSALHGMFGGTTVPIHLKVMAYIKFG